MTIENMIDEGKEEETLDSKEEENVNTDGVVDLEEENVKMDEEMDLEEETMCSLSERYNLRKKKFKQKEQLKKYEEEGHHSKSKMSQSLNKTKNIIMHLKAQLEEEIRIE